MTDKNNCALVFPGQGSQAVGMGKDLYNNFVVAREVFDEVDDILDFKLSKIIFEGPADQLTKTENAQPALMAVSIAIIRILEKEFNKKLEDICSLVAGHSLGEYSALCAAGAISLDQTAKLLQIRGQAMAKCGQKTDGAMAAIIGTDIEVVQQIADLASEYGICQVANDNSVGQVVISGSKVAVEKALTIAKEKGAKRAILLPVSGAFHSSLMADAASYMKQSLQHADIKSPSVPLIANVTAGKVTDPKIIKELLVKQVTGSVKWRQTMLFMEKYGIKEVIEIGSGKVLSGLATRTCSQINAKSIQNTDDIKLYVDTEAESEDEGELIFL